MNQLNLFDEIDINPAVGRVKSGLNFIRNGEYYFHPSFFSVTESNTYLKDLNENILWKQESINMYGKRINFPRLTSWYGDSDKPYSFSGITLSPHS